MSAFQYLSKHGAYYQNERPDLFGMLSKNPEARALDIGCSEGGLGAALKREGLAGYVAGIEPFSSAATIAERRLDDVIADNVERVDFAAFTVPFDIVICEDVLEHLFDPWSVLAQINQVLKVGGQLLVSVPNVGHGSVIWSLLRARWAYQDQGLLDRTHLRFFTRESIRSAIEDAGFEIDVIEVNRGYSFGCSEVASSVAPPTRYQFRSLLKKLLGPAIAKAGRDLSAYQFRILATKK